jgi:hypothetical protein
MWWMAQAYPSYGLAEDKGVMLVLLFLLCQIYLPDNKGNVV